MWRVSAASGRLLRLPFDLEGHAVGKLPPLEESRREGRVRSGNKLDGEKSKTHLGKSHLQIKIRWRVMSHADSEKMCLPKFGAEIVA